MYTFQIRISIARSGASFYCELRVNIKKQIQIRCTLNGLTKLIETEKGTNNFVANQANNQGVRKMEKKNKWIYDWNSDHLNDTHDFEWINNVGMEAAEFCNK